MATSLTLSASASLSDDYIYTSDIQIDPTSTSPVAMFQAAAGPAALVVAADNSLQQVTPAAGQGASGWSAAAIAGATGVTAVVAGVQNDGSIHAFYTDAAHLRHMTLNGGAWSSPDTLPLCTALQATINNDTGELIVTGVDAAGALLFVRQKTDGSWGATSIAFPITLAGSQPAVTLTDANCDWTMAMPNPAGGIDLYTGTPTAMQSGPDNLAVTNPVQQVIVALWANNGPLFLFNDNQGNLYATDGAQVVAVPTAKIAIASAAAILDLQSKVHLFTVSPSGTVSVLHQTGWSDASSSIPTWAPVIPLNAGMQALHADLAPTDVTAFFGTDTAGALWFFQQDSVSSPWRAGKAQAPGGAKSYRVAQYRTELTLTDQNGNPAPNVPVSVTASRLSGVAVGGQHYPIGPSQSVTVTTNALGRATLSTVAAGLDTAALSFAAPGLTPTPPLNPAAPLHAYLSGNGTLNDGTTQARPVFGAATLQQAQVGGQPLAPQTQDPTNGLQRAQAATDGIAAMLALPSSGGTAAVASGVFGYSCDLTGPTPYFRVHRSAAEFATARARLLEIGPGAGLGDWWNDVEDFFEDVWSGIETGVVTIFRFTVDAVEQVISLVVQIGDEIHKIEKAAITDIKRAVAVVQGILAQIGAFIKEVIEWLEMLFDWGDIWNTMEALKSALDGAFPAIQQAIEQKAKPLVKGFFATLEKQVSSAFDTVAARYANGETLASLVPATAIHDRRMAAAPPINGPSPAVLAMWLAQSQNNWLFDKIESYLGGSLPSIGDLAEPINDLKSAIDQVLDKFQDAANTFGNFIIAGCADPKNFSSLAVNAFLVAAKDVAIAVLAFMDGIVEAFLDVIAAGCKAVGAILEQTLEVPFLSSVINDIASLIGVSLPSFSIAKLFCLALAIPITVLYKLVNGAGTEPFPGGNLPSGALLGAMAQESDGAKACQFVAAGLAALWALYDTALDAVENVDLMVLKIIDVVLPALVGVFTWPGFIPFSTIPFETPEDIAAFCDWMVGWAVVALDVVLLLVSGAEWPEGSVMARYQDPAGKVLLCAVGAVDLIAGVVASSLGTTGGSIAANLLGPLPLITQVLRLDSVEEASEGLSLAIKLVVDFFAGEGYAAAVAVS